jgi:PAS domain S-box-containing protein
MTIAAKIILVQETDKDRQSGMLMYSPVYRQGAAIDSVDNRRLALQGFVYSPVRMNDFIYGTLGKLPQDISFEVYADVDHTPDDLMFSSLQAEKTVLPRGFIPEFTREIRVEAYGRNWIFSYRSLPAFSLRLEKGKSYTSLGISIFASILLGWISFLLLNTRGKALLLAEKMTLKSYQSDARFRAIIMESPVPYAINDEQLNVTILNPAFSKTFGYTLVDIPTVAQWWSRAYPDPVYREWVVSTWAKHLEQARIEGAEFEPIEVTIRCNNGSDKTVIATAAPLGNAFLGEHLVILYDITKRKQTEDKLRGSEARYQEIMREESIILDNSPIAISMVIDRTQVWVNHKTEVMFQYPREELVNQTTRKLYPTQEAYDRLGIEANPLLAQGQVFETVQEMLRRDGSVVMIRFIGKAINPSDLSKGTIWLLEDITQRIQTEEAVRQSEAFTRATLDALAANICVLDEHGVILMVNRGWRNFAEANPPVPNKISVGANYIDICDAVQGDESLAALRFVEGIRAVKSGELESYDQEYACHSAAEQRWFHGRVTRFADCVPLRLVVTHENITQEKQLAAAFHDSEKRFRLLFDRHSAVMLLIEPITGRIQDANIAAGTFYGYSQDDLRKMNISDVNCLTPAEIVVEMQQARDEGRNCFVFPHRLADGNVRTVEVHSTPISSHGVTLLFSIIHDITDRLRAEEEIRNNSAWLTALKERSPIGIMVASIDRVIIDTNSSFCNMFGYCPEELVGQTVRSIHVSEAASLDFSKRYYHLIQNGQQVHAEFQFQRKNGEIFWADIAGQAIMPGDLAMGTIWILQDISEHRKLQLELLRLTCEQGAVLDASSVGITMVKKRIQIWSNRAMGEIFGYSLTEMANRSTQTFYSSVQEFERYGKEIHRRFAEGLDYRNELEMRHKSGALIWIRLQGKVLDPLQIDEGSVWIFEDISKYKALEAQRLEQESLLRRSEAKFSKIFSTTPDLIAISLKENGQFLEVNDAFERITGFTREETIGHTFLELSGWEFIEDQQRLLENLADHKRLVNYHTRFRRMNREVFPVSLSLEQAEINGAECLIICARDITDQERAQEELRRSKAAAEAACHAKSEFLANMSHEIRTPLNAIIGFGDLIMQTELSLQQRNYLVKMNASARLLLGLINDILDISKVEAGMLTLEQVAFALPECLEKIADVIAVQAHAKGLEFRSQIAFDVPDYVTGDPFRLRQILLNLLGNAVKFTESGKVELAVTKAESDQSDQLILHFRASDTGIGLSEAQCHSIFESFAQGDSSTTRTYGGTGLGLAISKQLVELMGGAITVESEPGRGSVFSFTAKFARASGVVNTSTIPAHFDLRSLHGALVLVVEDNLINQEVAQLQLRRCGLQVMMAANGREALTMVAQSVKPFDLILMDIQMPEMDGYEVTRRLREQWGQEELPIIALTAHALFEEQEKCRIAGMNDHLAKPIDIAALHRVLLRWIKPDRGLIVAVEVEKAASNNLNLPQNSRLRTGEALNRLGGDQTIYLSLLRLFVKEYRQVADCLVRLLDAGDVPQTRLVVHTLKGAAGNLGALDLSKAAAAMETALKQQDLTDIHDLMANLETELSQTLTAVSDFEQSLQVEPLHCEELPIASELAVLSEGFASLLQVKDLLALEHYDRLHLLLKLHCPFEMVQKLDNCMELLDFDGAIEHWNGCQLVLNKILA